MPAFFLLNDNLFVFCLFSSIYIAEAAKFLRKTYFSGGLYLLMCSPDPLRDIYIAFLTFVRSPHPTGTVSASIADIDYIKRRDSIEQLLEDGTVSFLSIASIRHGFKIINTLTPYAIDRYVYS